MTAFPAFYAQFQLEEVERANQGLPLLIEVEEANRTCCGLIRKCCGSIIFLAPLSREEQLRAHIMVVWRHFTGNSPTSVPLLSFAIGRDQEAMQTGWASAPEDESHTMLGTGEKK